MISNRRLLENAINIPRWLELDRDRDWHARVSREYQIVSSDSFPVQPVEQRVLHWWAVVRDKQHPGPGNEIAVFFRRISWLVMVAGLITGAGLCGVLLQYDGSQPINVLMVFAWLVLLPFGFFLLSLGLPFLHSSGFISSLNPGRMMCSFLKNKNASIESFFSSSRADTVKEAFIRWRFMLYSQQFGLALSIAALVALLARVTFSDLAFGWSTTLDVQAGLLIQWIHGLAWPWHVWLPDAVPSAALIEASRYFRLENSPRNLSAESLTGWWGFIAMSLLVYGVGFRLLALMIVNFYYRDAIRSLLMQHAEVSALLDRLDRSAGDPRDATDIINANESLSSPSLDRDIQNVDLMICWYGARPVNGMSQPCLSIDAGNEDTLQGNGDLLQGRHVPKDGHVRIITKSWEPPLLEFHDFIRALRRRLGDQVTIAIHPVPAGSQMARDTDIEIWRHSIERLQDPRVYVI